MPDSPQKGLISTIHFLYHRAPVDAGWSSLAARRAHNPKVAGSNPAPATTKRAIYTQPVERPCFYKAFCIWGWVCPQDAVPRL